MTEVGTSFSVDDIERVLREWERLHPGKSADRNLSSEEFADLMLADMYARMKMKIIKQPTES